MASPSFSLQADQLPDSHENGEQEEDSRSAKGIFNELLPTLPREYHRTMDISHYQYQGFWFNAIWLEGTIWAQKNIKARDDDVFIASFPKCGTTWSKALVFSIMNRNRYGDSDHPLLTKNPHECVLTMELLVHRQATFPYSLTTPRLLSTLAPYTSLPESILYSGSKIVYICRNPKDSFVSNYHFMSKIRSFENQHQLLEEMFDSFCIGVSPPGPFWDHMLGYWNASLERPDKVLFLKYEDMKADIDGVVKKMAEFIGHPFSAEEENDGAVRKVTKLCSMESLSNMEVNKNGEFRFFEASGEVKVGNHVNFRKGKVGDFKNLMTEEMNKRIDQITEQKLTGTGLKF